MDLTDKISKKEYSQKLNKRLDTQKILGHEIDFSRLGLKDLLDLNELFIDPRKIKALAVALGADLLDGEVLNLIEGVAKDAGLVDGGKPVNGSKPLTGGVAGQAMDQVGEAVTEEVKARAPLLGTILERARERMKKNREQQQTEKKA